MKVLINTIIFFLGSRMEANQTLDPQMIHFELFYHLVHRSQLNPKQYLFTFGS